MVTTVGAVCAVCVAGAGFLLQAPSATATPQSHKDERDIMIGFLTR
jgi:hypothetical protein